MSDEANPKGKMEPMFLPGVENNPQPGPYADAIRMMQAAGPEYPQIWHMFAFGPRRPPIWRVSRRRSCASPGR